MFNHFDNFRFILTLNTRSFGSTHSGVWLTIEDQGLIPVSKDKRFAHEADPEYGVSKDCDT
jgi:hypothetical protein